MQAIFIATMLKTGSLDPPQMIDLSRNAALPSTSGPRDIGDIADDEAITCSRIKP
jgi:hypothetical protein